MELLQGLAPYFDPGTVSPRSDVPLPAGGEIWAEMPGWNVGRRLHVEAGPQGPRLLDAAFEQITKAWRKST